MRAGGRESPQAEAIHHGGGVRGGWSLVVRVVVVASMIVAGCGAVPAPTSGNASAASSGPGEGSGPGEASGPGAPTPSGVPVAGPGGGAGGGSSQAPAPPAASSTAGLAGPSPSGSGAATPAARLPGEPDPSLTPGATNPAVTQATIDTTICVSGWAASVRPPSSYTTALKRRQIAGYGYADTKLADYEEDHLIPLELGGAPSDARNLWPEPYTIALPDGTPVGARVKDQLENELNALVCAGSMPLARAQALIRVHWIAAWRTYVLGVTG